MVDGRVDVVLRVKFGGFNMEMITILIRRRVCSITDLGAENLALKLKFFQQNRRALVEMAINARAQFKPDAADHLAAGILAGAIS